MTLNLTLILTLKIPTLIPAITLILTLTLTLTRALQFACSQYPRPSPNPSPKPDTTLDKVDSTHFRSLSFKSLFLSLSTYEESHLVPEKEASEIAEVHTSATRWR